MEKELYTWKQVESYCIIALNNLLHSANDIKLKNMTIFIKPLKNLHSKDKVEEYANQLIENEKYSKN